MHVKDVSTNHEIASIEPLSGTSQQFSPWACKSEKKVYTQGTVSSASR